MVSYQKLLVVIGWCLCFLSCSGICHGDNWCEWRIADGDGNLVTFDGTYDVLEITLNGDSATVSGIEMSYSQKFLNGFFVDTNLAFMDSEAHDPGFWRCAYLTSRGLAPPIFYRFISAHWVAC